MNQLEKLGLSKYVNDAQQAVRLGGLEMLKVHGLTPEKPQITFKTDAGSTPKTITVLNSGNINRHLINSGFPHHDQNKKEFGFFSGNIISRKIGKTNISGQTVNNISHNTQLVVGGNLHLVDQVAPIVAKIFQEYQGFS